MTMALSRESSIQLGLALGLVGATWILYEKIDSVKDATLKQMSESYVTKELFTSAVSSMKREVELQLGPLARDVSDLKAAVAALSKTQDGR